MIRFLPSLLMSASFVSFAFAEWEPVLEFNRPTTAVPMSLKPVEPGKAMPDVISSILNHKSSAWDNGLQKLDTSRPFLVKGPSDELFCITHYLAGQTARISDRRRTFAVGEIDALEKKGEIPLTVVGMRTNDFLEEVKRSRALPPSFRTITPSRSSLITSHDHSIEEVADPKSFKLLTIPFDSIRRHSTGASGYPSHSMVRLPDPSNRYSRVCEATINKSDTPSLIEMPRTSVAFVIRPWEEVKQYYPDAENSDLNETSSKPSSSKVESEEGETWVPATEFFADLDREDDASRLQPKHKSTEVQDGFSELLSETKSSEVPRIISPVFSDDNLITAHSSEHPKGPRLLPDNFLIPSYKADIIAQFLYKCYGGGVDLTREAHLIDSGLLDILNLTPRTRKKVRVSNSPKSRRGASSDTVVHSDSIGSTARYYIDPRNVPEKLTIIAGALGKAAGEVNQETIDTLANIYDISKAQAAGVFDGFNLLDHEHSYRKFFDKTIAEHDSEVSGAFDLVKALKEHFQIPRELAVELFDKYMEEKFVKIEGPSDSTLTLECVEDKGSPTGAKANKGESEDEFNPLEPDEAMQAVARLTYLRTNFDSKLKGKASVDARYFAAAKEMALLFQRPLTQMFAIVGGIKFDDPNIVYKLAAEELLRARDYFALSESEAKDPIINTLMAIFSIDKKIATRIYDMVPSAPIKLENNFSTFKSSDLWSFDMLTFSSDEINNAMAAPIIELHKSFASVDSSYNRLLLAFSLQRILNLKWLDAYKLTKEEE